MAEGETMAGGGAAGALRGGAPRRRLLPNGMEIAYQSRAEVDFFYKDIFEKQIYLKHGVALHDGDTVFDVGANIGFFTLFAHRQARDLTVYAFEPAPPLFEILSLNAEAHGVNARLFNCGVSAAPGSATLTFYPNSSGMTTFYAEQEAEKEVLRAIMENQLRQGVAGMERVMRHADDLLEERFKSLSYECRLRTLSEVIREERVERIDFLKIDVQKSESDVLAGIDEADWPKIRQLVIEVHDIDDRLGQIHGLLRGRGYEVAVEQDDHYENSILYNLFARRAGAADAGAAPRPSAPLGETSLTRIKDRAQKQGAALNRGRQIIEQRKKGR
jgi:FkbM family methyltransferase